MARITNDQRLSNLHSEALKEFDDIQSALRDERLQCLQDRRFYSISGAQWEGPLGDQFENKPKFEVNKIMLSVMRIVNEYRNNRITVDYTSKDGRMDDLLADTCDGLYRADEQDSVAHEAYDNAFEEAVGGGYGAWRLRTVYEDEEDDEDERQRIRIEPIFDADSSVFFDLQAKRQDKSDAKTCFVITSMTYAAYEETYEDTPTSWPKLIHQYEFDWCTPDVVYVAEYYRVEEVTKLIRIFAAVDGTEERYTQDDFKDDETLEETLMAIGSREIRQKRIKTKRVHKYIMSGGRILEDNGYIAGKCIPIVPVYGKRWFIDNIERCMGHVRLAKDAQRLKNMQLSKLGEISALSSIEKPILIPEQVAGHQLMWAEDNLKNYPYLLLNPITGADGQTQAAGAMGYTKSAAIPPAMAALLQLTDADINAILGNQGAGEQIVSNISGKAVELIQNKLDMQTFIYMSNMAKAMRRCGEVWLSIARDIYTEEGRKMKSIGVTGDTSTVELMKPMISDTGEMIMRNDMTEAKFDVNVEVGPSSSSKRAATVRALMGMMQVTNDPETQGVLQSMAMMNMEGEGINDVRTFFRARLVKMGVIKPTEEEAMQMQASMENQPQDPNAIFLEAAAEEAMAKAANARADTVKTIAEAELTQAKTLETMTKVSDASPVDERTALEIESLRLENQLRKNRVDSTESQIEQLRAERQANDSMIIASENMAQAVAVIGDAVGKMSSAVEQFSESNKQNTEVNKQNTEAALAAINKPKRIVREKGRISRIETEE